MIINYGYQKELDRRLTLLDLLCVVSLVMSPHSKTQRLKDRKEDSRERELSYPIIQLFQLLLCITFRFSHSLVSVPAVPLAMPVPLCFHFFLVMMMEEGEEM